MDVGNYKKNSSLIGKPYVGNYTKKSVLVNHEKHAGWIGWTGHEKTPGNDVGKAVGKWVVEAIEKWLVTYELIMETMEHIDMDNTHGTVGENHGQNW